MRPPQEIYDQIPQLTHKDLTAFFQRIPGCYCINCGEVFALYSYSAVMPRYKDENGKPYYKTCFMCVKPDPRARAIDII